MKENAKRQLKRHSKHSSGHLRYLSAINGVSNDSHCSRVEACLDVLVTLSRPIPMGTPIPKSAWDLNT